MLSRRSELFAKDSKILFYVLNAIALFVYASETVKLVQ